MAPPSWGSALVAVALCSFKNPAAAQSVTESAIEGLVRHSSWSTPYSVVSAECRSTLAPGGTNNDAGINDILAVGGEPAGTCNADEMENAGGMLQGKSTNFYVARGSGKEYYFVYDLGTERYVDAIEMVGISTGHWCEDGAMGAYSCHNDNSFMVAFSTNGEDWSSYNENFDDREACARLHDGCGWTFSARSARYLKLRVTSSCAGCTNEDRVTGLFLKPALDLKTVYDKLSANGADLDDFVPGTWRSPSRLISAECRSTLAPDGTNNDAGINDIYAVGGEPAGTCNADETENAEAVLKPNGATTNFRVASGSGKEYYFVYQFGSPHYIDAFELLGHSEGHWCEDSLKGANNCHNDNNFMVAFSEDGESWSPYNEGFDHRDQCNRLDDGCGWTFSPRKVQFFKLRVTSSCAGCQNTDHVTDMKVRLSHSMADIVDRTIASAGNVTTLQNALVLTERKLEVAQGAIAALQTDVRSLTSRLDKLHLSYTREVQVPDIAASPPATETPADSAQLPPVSVEATPKGSLTLTVSPGSRVYVNDGDTNDFLLTKGEVQGMIRKAVEDALRAAADASE